MQSDRNLIVRIARRTITSEVPVIRPRSMPRAEITSHKPTYQGRYHHRLHIKPQCAHRQRRVLRRK